MNALIVIKFEKLLHYNFYFMIFERLFPNQISWTWQNEIICILQVVLVIVDRLQFFLENFSLDLHQFAENIVIPYN
jgi:hypothetical protein